MYVLSSQLKPVNSITHTPTLLTGWEGSLAPWLSRRACGHVDVGTRPHQVLASTPTLSQPGSRLCPPQCYEPPPDLQTLRRPCTVHPMHFLVCKHCSGLVFKLANRWHPSAYICKPGQKIYIFIFSVKLKTKRNFY